MDKVSNTSTLDSSASVTHPPLGENEFMIGDCTTESVVVYLDRAEVSRSFKASVRKGENEIVLKGLSQCVDKDSIRVEGRGSATILEVAFQSKFLTPDEAGGCKDRQKKLEKELDDARRRAELLKLKQIRLTKQRHVLDGFADNAMKGAGINTTEESKNNGSFLSKDNLVGMTAFLDLYDRQTDKLDSNLYHVRHSLDDCDKLISTITSNLSSLNVTQETHESRELCILLEATEAADVILCVSYVVSKAMWTPKYDVRVFGEERQMKIQYYGMIQQSTGEDWQDARICLSTATPSVGGNIPVLGTQQLSFKKRLAPSSVWSRKSLMLSRRRRRSLVMEAELATVEDNDSVSTLPNMAMSEPVADAIPQAALQVQRAEVKESITTTMYEIARRSNIPSDNVAHKVTVAIIDLTPTFEYQTLPKMSAKAFLKAKVKNTSPYALLAGPTNVFLDNNFIAKAELKAVSPMEEFTCSLGVDPTVRIDYKPLNKYREQSGLISKTTAMTYRQVIEVKNTHKEPIRILVSDQLPLSTEEKIKVNLLEPTIKHPEKYDVTRPIRLSPLNHVEWLLEVGAGEIREIVLKYNVEHPSGESLDTEVVHGGSQGGSDA